MKRPLILTIAVLMVASLVVTPALASSVVTTPHGTWTAYPGQATLYQTSVQQPINADSSSNFKANGKAVIPVKFGLAQGTGGFIFESFVDNDPATYPYSFLEFDPSTPPTFSQITTLIAVYQFTVGDCYAGSLRWTLYLNDNGVTRNLDVHYQPGANGLSQQTCAAGTSGQNLIGSTDTIYVTQEFNGGYSFPSPYNNTYADTVSQLGNLQVLGMNLIVDSGFAGNERVNLTSATVGVGGTNPYTETFTPQPASSLASTCPTQQASIKITKTDGVPTGDVNEPLSIQPNDNNGIFRIVDCKYMYNLATSSLSGVGTYSVTAIINGVPASNPAVFDLK